MPIKVLMPALSPTMTEGTLAKWLVGEGDEVNSGDVIAEIETDKATMEVEAVDEGRVGKLLVSEGTEGVKVNTVIAMLLTEGEDASTLAGGAPAAAAAAKPEKKAEAQPVKEAPAPKAPAPALVAAPAAPAAPQPRADGDRVFASPLARRMAEQSGVDLAGVHGSGPHGRIVKRDIEATLAGAPKRPAAAAPAAAAQPAAAPVTAERLPYEPEFDLVPLSGMRRTIARRLAESKRTVPHFYLTVDCEIDKLL
ncbi:MAG: biotin/lipoyl-containing protein, partial [Alphaproteobacteria bacterium]